MRPVRLQPMLEAVTVQCQECSVEPAGDSPEIRLELTIDDELVVYCEACWKRSSARAIASVLTRLAGREPPLYVLDLRAEEAVGGQSFILERVSRLLPSRRHVIGVRVSSL